jgi:hypothetical protein
MTAQHADLTALCSALIDLANERGGPDNITVVAARFEGEGLPEPGGAEGVGHHKYQLAQTTTEAEVSTPNPEGLEPGGGPATQSVREATPASYPPADLIRTVALILITAGVLLLLLAVWR